MKTLHLVDGTGYIFRAYHAIKPMRNMAGTPINAVLGFTRMLLKLIKDHKPSQLAVVFDAGGETFRKQLYAEYKANRQEQPEDIRVQIPLCFESVDALGIPRLQVAGVEADDVLGTMAREATARGWHVSVVTGDKDLLQLVNPQVDIIRYNTRTETEDIVDEEGVRKLFGVTPAQVVDVLALMGDASDNVPGVDGIGEKTAVELIATHGSVEGVLAAAPSMKPGKRRDTLMAQADRARLSRELVLLRLDVPLPTPLDALEFRGLNIPTSRAFFTHMGFKALLNDAMFAVTETPAPKASAPDPQGQLSFDAPVPPAAAPAAEIPEAPALLAMGTLPSTGWLTVETPDQLTAVAGHIARTGVVAIHTVHTDQDVLRARLLGLAVAWEPGQAAYIPLRDQTQLLQSGLAVDLVRDVLVPVLGSARLCAHDGKEALKVLQGHGFPPLRLHSDAMLASYVLAVSDVHDLGHVCQRHLRVNLTPLPAGPRGKTAAALESLPLATLAHHAAERADAAFQATRLLEEKLRTDKLWDLYQDLEIPLSDVLMRMEQAGVLVRSDVLRQLQQELSAECQRLEQEVHQLAGGAFNLQSPKQLADVLFTRLSLPVQRKTKTGPSTDMDVLEQLSELHPLPAKVLEHRQLHKLISTYLEALPALVHPSSGRIHTTYHQAVAATGRLSSQDPNLQNIPIREERGRRIRSAFVAPPGKVLLSADYSQIELRILAHVSRDAVLLAAFERGEDVHTRTASEVLNIPLADVTREQRRAAKTINFGLLYGMSAFGLSQALKIPRGEAKEYLTRYYARLGGVQAWQEQTLADARKNGLVTTLFGRRRFLPDINQKNNVVRQAAERIATNTPIQGTAADIIKRAMVTLDARIREQALPARVILQVHDELVLEVDAQALDTVKPHVRAAMEGAASLSVKLEVEMGAGPDWGAAHG